MYRVDEPNRVYIHMGEVIGRLARVGATKKELAKIFHKGGSLTLQDIEEVESKHFHKVTK